MKLLTKKIGILGYGAEGKSVAGFLESRRVRWIFKFMMNRNQGFQTFLKSKVEMFSSDRRSKPHHPELQKFRGKIIGSAELFFQLCPTKK